MIKVKPKPRLLIFITEDWYYWSHRRCIALAAKDAGYEVFLITRVHKLGDKILNDGINLIPISLRRKEKNPFRELYSFLELIKIYRDIKPSIVHHVTIKPVIYGTIISNILGIKSIVNALAGLGHLFTTRNFKLRILKIILIRVFKLIFIKTNSKMIFQNHDDMAYFVNNKILNKQNISLIRGAGVDENIFQYVKEYDDTKTLLLAGRLL